MQFRQLKMLNGGWNKHQTQKGTKQGTALPQGLVDSRFDIYWQVHNCIAHYETTVDNIRTPNPQELFDCIGENFNEDFLHHVVRGGKKKDIGVDSSPIATQAIEIQVRRLKPHLSEGGAVQLPPFYVAFVCDEKPVPRLLNDEEKHKLTQHAYRECMKHLKEAYPKDGHLVDFAIAIDTVEINEDAAKPEPKFNLYVQFDAVATFVDNVPEESMDVFRILTRCMSREFLSGARECGGPILGNVIQMAIRVCVWSDLPDMDKVRGTGDAIYAPMKHHVEFFVALVVRSLESMPDTDEQQQLDCLVHEFLSNYLLSLYPDMFGEITLESTPKFKAGRPLPRFNHLHQYVATLQFRDDPSHPPPDPVKVLTKIVNCNVGALLSHINGSPSTSNTWKRTAEVTLGRGIAQLPKDHAYGGKIDPLPTITPQSTENGGNGNKPSVLGNGEAQKPVRSRVTPTNPAVPPGPKQSPGVLNKILQTTTPYNEKKLKQTMPSSKATQPSTSSPTNQLGKSNIGEPKKKPAVHGNGSPSKSAPINMTQTSSVNSKATGKSPADQRKSPGVGHPLNAKNKAAVKADKNCNGIGGDNRDAEKAIKSKPRASNPPTTTKSKESNNGKTRLSITQDNGEEKSQIPKSVSVKTSDVYLSLTVANCDASPSKSDFKALIETTTVFYSRHLTNVFGSNLEKVDLAIHHDEFDTGKPLPKYNVYVEWDIDAYFKDRATAPSRHKLCESLIHLDVMVLLKDHVRSLDSTPFKDAIGIYTQQVNS